MIGALTGDATERGCMTSGSQMSDWLRAPRRLWGRLISGFRSLPKPARYIITAAAVSIAVALGAVVYVTSLSSLVAIGTRQAPMQDPREGMVHPLVSPLLWVSQDRKSFVVRVCRWHAQGLVSELRRRPNIRYALIVGSVTPDFATPLGPLEHSETLSQAISAARSSPDVIDVVPLRIESANYKIDRLIDSIGAPKPLHMVPGRDLAITGVSKPFSASDTIRMNIRDSTGAQGTFIVTRAGQQLHGELEIQDIQFTLEAVSDTQYLLIRRDERKLPPEGDSGGPQVFPQDELGSRATSAAPPSSSAVAAPNIKIVVGFTRAAIQRVMFQRRSYEETAADPAPTEEEALHSLLQALLERDNDAFGKPEQRWGSITVTSVVADVEQPDGVDAIQGLQRLCGAGEDPPRGTRAALRDRMLKDAADVAVVVVNGLCAPPRIDGKAHLSCGPVEPDLVSCPSGQDDDDLCGLSTGIGRKTDYKTGFALVNAICIRNKTIHHEIGHFLDAQHRDDVDRDAEPTAHGYADPGGGVVMPWRTLMVTSRECKRCTRYAQWSSPDQEITVPDQSGKQRRRPAGGPGFDNLSEVRKNLPRVADFHRLRQCERTAPRTTVEFQFNLPRLKPRRHPALSAMLESGQFDKLVDYTNNVIKHRRTCPEFVISAVGATDSVPGPRPDYNKKLSVERAETIESWLGAQDPVLTGVNAICGPDGVGAHDPIIPTKPSGLTAESRRVVLRSVYLSCPPNLLGEGRSQQP